MDYMDYTYLDMNNIDMLFNDMDNIETLQKLKNIVEPYEFDIETTDIDKLDFVDGLHLATLKCIVEEYHKKEIELHYTGLKTQRYTQLWSYASTLYYGTDVNIGGGDYAQAVNVDYKKKYYSLIIKAYSEIKQYENIINQDYKELQKTNSISSEHEFIYDLHAICQAYHKEVEFIQNDLDITPINTKEERSDLSKNGIMPEKLDKPEFMELLKKLINGGFCDKDYKWQRSKALLSYFADRASEYLKIGKGQTADGEPKISWTPFEDLFLIKDNSGGWIRAKGLSGARNDYKKIGTLPLGNKDVDKLF